MTFSTFASAIPIQCVTLDAIEKSATAFGKPVLLFHDDNHYSSIEPLKTARAAQFHASTMAIPWFTGFVRWAIDGTYPASYRSSFRRTASGASK